MSYLSVIVCTRNPRKDYLARVFDALKAQTLPKAQWELLLVDNASETLIDTGFIFLGLSNARTVREEKMGKTHALLCGIRESKGSVLITVDDDNVLASDYLAAALEMMNEYPDVGVWSGTNVAEFEINPSSWKNAFLPYLAINKEFQVQISKDMDVAPLPIGAGMVFCRKIATAYFNWMTAVTKNREHSLGRNGNRLHAGEEDTELGIVAIKNGFACGRTPRLRLTHLIPRRRIAAAYLFRIVRDISYSHALLYRWHGLRRGQFSKKDFFRQILWFLLLTGAGAVSGNTHRFGRGLAGITSLYGTLLARRQP